MDCGPPGSSVHGDCPGKNAGVGCHALHPGDLPNPGVELGSPALQACSFPSGPVKPAESTENSKSVRVTLDLSQKHGEDGEDRRQGLNMCCAVFSFSVMSDSL